MSFSASGWWITVTRMEEAYWLLAIISLTVSLLIVELDNKNIKKLLRKKQLHLSISGCKLCSSLYIFAGKDAYAHLCGDWTSYEGSGSQIWRHSFAFKKLVAHFNKKNH